LNARRKVREKKGHPMGRRAGGVEIAQPAVWRTGALNGQIGPVVQKPPPSESRRCRGGKSVKVREEKTTKSHGEGDVGGER